MPGETCLNNSFLEHLRKDPVNNLDGVFRHLFVAHRQLHKIAEFYHLDLEPG